MKYGKRAQVALATEGKAIEITIDDEGPGIPESELPKVFQPFYRIEDSRSHGEHRTFLPATNHWQQPARSRRRHVRHSPRVIGFTWRAWRRMAKLLKHVKR